VNAELTYTLELARSMDRFICEVDGAQEKTGGDLAFSRAIKRGREAVISMLENACRDLAPAEGAEIARFIRSLEYGELPAIAEEQSWKSQKTPNAKVKKFSVDGRAGETEAHTKPPRASNSKRDFFREGALEISAGSAGGRDDVDEKLIEQCVEIIRQEKRASTSLIQRRLRLGYTRAARILEILQGRGIVGPGEGAQPREILIDLNSPPLPPDEKSREVMSQWRS